MSELGFEGGSQVVHIERQRLMILGFRCLSCSLPQDPRRARDDRMQGLDGREEPARQAQISR